MGWHLLRHPELLPSSLVMTTKTPDDPDDEGLGDEPL